MKFASICIIGKPNVGKSTLLNQLLKSQVSIVTYKPQTTRSVIKGIITKGQVQLAFLDTPGIFQSNSYSNKLMMQNTYAAINSADIVLAIFSVKTSNIQSDIAHLNKLIYNLSAKIIFLFNKIDLLTQAQQNSIKLVIKNTIKQNIPVFFISAQYNNNVDKLLKYLVKNAKNASWQYKGNIVTPHDKSFIAQEITRKVIMLNLKQEIPYHTLVVTESYKQEENEIYIIQNIIVIKQIHKKIMLGKKGTMIGKIRQDVTEQIAKLFNQSCHLRLFVKVRKDAFTKLTNFS